jgi:hypothetical protein
VEGLHVRVEFFGYVITLTAQIRVRGMILRPGMSFHRPPLNFYFREPLPSGNAAKVPLQMIPDIGKEILITPLAVGTFIIKKNL